MMARRLKYILFFILGTTVLFTLLAALVVATMDDADYQKMVTRTVEYITGYKVVVDGDFVLDLSMEPYLAVSKVRFGPGKDASQPHIDHIGRFQLKLSARHLFAGKLLIKQLLVDDATVLLPLERERRPRSTRIRKKRGRSSMLVPVVENAVFRNINLHISNRITGSIAEVDIDHLKIGEAGANGHRYVSGQGAVNAQEFKVEGQLGSIEQIFSSQQPYPVLMNVKTANADFNVSGKIDDLVHGEGLDLHLSGEVADLSSSLRLFRVAHSGLGRLTFAADIVGNMSSPQVLNLDVVVAGESNTQFTAKGSVKNVFNGDGTDIFIDGSTSKNDLIRLFLPPIMADFSRLDIRCRLRKHQSDFVLEEIDAAGSNDQGLAMTASGSLNFGDFKGNILLKEIDLGLRLTAPTTVAAKRFLIDWLPEIGPVNGKGRLQGSGHQLALEDLFIGINESGPLKVASQGRIGQIPTQKGMHISELDLKISVQTAKTAPLSKALDMPLPELGSVSARFRVNFMDDRLQFNEVDVQTSDRKGLKVAFSGRVGEIPVKSPKPYGDVNFSMRMTAPNMGAVEPLIGTRILQDVGPVAAAAQITGTTDILSLKDLTISAGRADAARIEMRGEIGKIPLSRSRIIAGCSIDGSIHADDTSDLGSLLGVSCPSLGQLQGAWRLVDRDGGFGVDGVKLSMSKGKGFRLDAAGKIDSIFYKGKVAVSGAEFDLSGSAVSMDAVPMLAGMGFSDLGPLKMSAKLYGGKDGFDIQNIAIYEGSEAASTLLVEGGIYATATREKVKITTTFKTQTRPWIKTLVHRSTPQNQQLTGRLVLLREAAAIRIEALDITTEDQQPLAFAANGLLKKMDGSYTMDVHVSAAAKDPSILGAMLGVTLPSLSPLTAEGRFNTNGNDSGFEGEIHLGKTVLKTTAHRTKQNHKPHLKLVVYSPTVYLSDMGIYPQASIDEAEKKKTIQPEKSRIFSRKPMSLEVLKGPDLSIKIDADKLVGKNFEMKHLDFDLSLRDGRLRISPARIGYAGGNIAFESFFKTDEPKPEISIKANAEDLDVDAFLAYAHKPLILGGQLNLAVDLHGAGRSFHDMASSLKGELGVAIENGRIKRDIELITADAFDVITSLPQIKGYQDLNCLVLKFTFEQGVGKSNIIFYDTPNVRTRGGGTVNLASETLDIVLQPKPKKGIPEFSSALYVSGSLANPSIRKMPFKEAARLAGEILMPYVFLPARALGYLWYLLKDDKEESSPCLIEEPGGE